MTFTQVDLSYMFVEIGGFSSVIGIPLSILAGLLSAYFWKHEAYAVLERQGREVNDENVEATMEEL